MKSRIANYYFAIGLLVAGVPGGAIVALEACSPSLTPAQQQQAARDQVELGVCATEAHLEKRPDASDNAAAWAAFDGCMVRKGFYDGGADAR